MSGKYIHSSACSAIMCGFHHRIVELAREVCRHRLKVPGFHLLGGAEKMSIKLIYDNLKPKTNVRTLAFWLIWKAGWDIVRIGWMLTERCLKVREEWATNKGRKSLLMKCLKQWRNKLFCRLYLTFDIFLQLPSAFNTSSQSSLTFALTFNQPLQYLS